MLLFQRLVVFQQSLQSEFDILIGIHWQSVYKKYEDLPDSLNIQLNMSPDKSRGL